MSGTEQSRNGCTVRPSTAIFPLGTAHLVAAHAHVSRKGVHSGKGRVTWEVGRAMRSVVEALQRAHCQPASAGYEVCLASPSATTALAELQTLPAFACLLLCCAHGTGHFMLSCRVT